MNKTYRYLLFDADGTLFDFDKAEAEALRQTLLLHGLPFSSRTRDLYRDINQNLWQELERGRVDKKTLQTRRFEELFVQTDLKADPVHFNDDYRAALAACSFLLPEAEKTCRQLAKTHQLAIITNGLAATQHQRFNGSPLARLIPDLFISDEIGFEKPHLGFFQHVLASMGIKRTQEALVIGDSLTADIAGGSNAGLDTCWYNPARLPTDPAIVPTYEIASLAELVQLLGKGCPGSRKEEEDA